MQSLQSLLLLFVGLFMVCSVSAQTQADKTDRIIDFRNDIRTLWQKSTKDLADNIIALPVLTTKSNSSISVPFVSDQENTYTSTIILGDNAEIYVLFNDFHLLENEHLIISSVQDLWERKKYTASDNKESGRLMIGPYDGDIELTYFTNHTPSLSIHQVYANPVNAVAMDVGFDSSFECHKNINCTEGQDYGDEKRAVTRIRMVAEEGVALCTGTLMNNTRGDRKPYVLTAFHCLVPPTGTITPLFDMWWFDFNYESFSCANPEEEPSVYAVQGAIKVAEWEDTDMMLMLIDDEIPLAANVYYAGWSRDLEYEPDTTFLIHHPLGDIKKVSFDFDPAVIHDRRIGWDNGGNSPENSHFKNEFDGSTYQPGSSGAAIFDQEGLVLGQLHGGPVSDEFCAIGIGYSGRIGVSWEGGETEDSRLKDWLDPLGSEPMSIEGINPKQAEFVRLSGQVITPDGLAIPKVRVSLTGDLNASFETGSDGRFVFENLDPEGSYDINFNKNTNARNGLSSTDMIIIRNHIIGLRPIDTEIGRLAADVSRDQSISSIDLVQVRNIIIGSNDQFPQSQSWGFSPVNLSLNNTNMDSEDMEVRIVGYKLGDVNYSSDPRR